MLIYKDALVKGVYAKIQRLSNRLGFRPAYLLLSIGA